MSSLFHKSDLKFEIEKPSNFSYSFCFLYSYLQSHHLPEEITWNRNRGMIRVPVLTRMSTVLRCYFFTQYRTMEICHRPSAVSYVYNPRFPRKIQITRGTTGKLAFVSLVPYLNTDFHDRTNSRMNFWLYYTGFVYRETQQCVKGR